MEATFTLVGESRWARRPYRKGPILNGKLKIISLGGSGEIGKNMLAFHYDETIIVVDAGVAFPTEEHLGVDLIIPDISYLLERRDMVKAICLTHGHEDHIGALPYVLK